MAMNRVKKGGRPTDYTIELVREICEAVATTSKGIKALCKENENWPIHDTIYRWLMSYKEFSDLYARAKRQQVEVIIDEILTIADDSSNDTYVNDDGKLIVDHEHINRARLRVDTRKWVAAKLAPRLYGAISDATVKLNFSGDLYKADALLLMAHEIFKQLSSGEITPDQADTLMNILKNHGANISAIHLAKEMTEFKEQLLQNNQLPNLHNVYGEK